MIVPLLLLLLLLQVLFLTAAGEPAKSVAAMQAPSGEKYADAGRELHAMIMTYPFLYYFKREPHEDAVSPRAFLDLVFDPSPSPAQTPAHHLVRPMSLTSAAGPQPCLDPSPSPGQTHESDISSSPVSKPQRPNKSKKGKKQGGSRKPYKG
jgi:hypothetical protein